MSLSEFVVSNDYFFTLGFSALLSRGLIDESYHIIDMETENYEQVANLAGQRRSVFAFISNDIDYYALQHFQNVTLIDRRSSINNVLSCLLANNPRFNYHVKHRLSERESKVLSCMLEGLNTQKICERLGISMKNFYAYRTRLIKKLQISNRITLYKYIARHRAIY